MPDPDPRYSTAEPTRSVIAARWIRSATWCALWFAILVPLLAVLRIGADVVHPATGDGMWILGTAAHVLINGKIFISGAIPILPLMIPVVFLATAADQRPSYVTWLIGAAFAAIAVSVALRIHPMSELRFIEPLLKMAVVGGALSGFAADRLARLTGLSTLDPKEDSAIPARGTGTIVAGALVVLTVFIWRDLWPR
jgi:hypothetical protein